MTVGKIGALRRKVGRRGLFLLFLALLDIIYGQSLFAPAPSSIASGSVYEFASFVAPLRYWAFLWIGIGIILAVFAFKAKDRVGFAVAMFFKILWGGMFLFGWAFAGVDRGYLSAAIWLAFAGVVALIATWPDEWKGPVTRGDANN